MLLQKSKQKSCRESNFLQDGVKIFHKFYFIFIEKIYEKFHKTLTLLISTATGCRHAKPSPATRYSLSNEHPETLTHAAAGSGGE